MKLEQLLRKGDAAMSVITISREFGSMGDEIAQRVALTLGYHFVDKHFFGTILGQYGYVEFDKEYESLPGFWERFDAQKGKQRDVTVTMLNRVIRAVAHHGDVVILGRSGFEVLGGFADVFHVRLQSPLEVRIQRVMEQQHLSHEQAETIVKENDRVRLAFVEEFYKVPWNSIHAFDLVINTAKVPPEMATEWIVEGVHSQAWNLDLNKPTTDVIVVDRIMAEAVAEVLEHQKVSK